MNVFRLLHSPLRLHTAIVALAAVLLAPAWARAEDLIRVEEDWELVIREPGTKGGQPQITTSMSPIGCLIGARTLFTINLDGSPEYESGGMRLLAWNNNVPGLAKTYALGTLPRFAGESITWTQVMEIERGVLYCSVVNGESESFGPFGGGNSLRVPLQTNLTSLNDYSQWVSFFSSGVSGTRLSPTRVQSLVLRQVRWYSPSGLEYLDNEPKLVY